jgi:glutamate synthase (NADPH/NADH) small chain
MGKPTGFMEFQREAPKERSPELRVNDWEEIEIHPSEDKLKIQGARCMDCGVPFCHTGTLIKGLRLSHQ